MKTRELILVSIIIGYVLINFSLIVFQNGISFENKDQSMQLIEVFGNGTTRSFEIDEPNPIPEIFASILESTIRLAYSLSMATVGIGIVSVPIGFLQTHLFVAPEGFRVLVFWIIAMITIPISYLFTKDIPLSRRIPYIYLLAAIVSATPMILNENFGK